MNTNPFTAATTRRRYEGFTLAELLVSMCVVLIIVFLIAQMMTSATAITTTGNKHISADT